MPVIAPLSAVRYPQARVTDLIAPPYDVLSPDDKARLLAKNGHNIVAVDLPHIPPSEAGPDAAYQNAAHVFNTWLEQGILTTDPAPALYAYQQTYSHAGITYRRRGLFARVRLEDFAEANCTIHPHEQTFSGPKEDRLKLIRATQANLSPVFGLYDDPSNDVTDLLFEAVRGRPPINSGDLPAMDGKSAVTSELWPVTDPAVIRDVTKTLAGKHVYIADGHHRYTTSLNYRKELSQALGTPLPHEHPANYCLMVLVTMQDPGLIILPTHRVVAAAGLQNFYLERFRQVAEPLAQVIETKFGGDQLKKLEAELPGYGPHAMGVYDPVADTAVVLRPLSPDPLAPYTTDPALNQKSAAWRQLDVAILQYLVLDRILASNFAVPGRKMTWAFPHEAREVRDLCRADGGTHYRVGFLLQPTPLTAVRDLCNANELMPQKSTFFYPKLATGLVINSLK